MIDWRTRTEDGLRLLQNRLTLGRSSAIPQARAKARTYSGAGRGRRVPLEQADLEVAGAVNHVAVGGEPAIGDPEDQLRSHHPLDLEAVDYLLHGRQHLAGEFQFAQAQRTAIAGGTQPAQE